ncbi:MAG: hypothetical protein K2Q11_02315 [Burkholderiaceae bacterium]|nr:hypothetical protein [Burkholderiaceae bacterium]
MKFRNALIAFGVAVVTGHSAALSLGESRSIVVLGRSPDLLFNVYPDPGISVDASCITAEVVLGTTPVSPSHIHIAPVADRPSAVRLRASLVVNEPIVTVHLSAGCSAKTRRTYTFLTDLPDSVVATATPLVVTQPAHHAPAPSSDSAVPAAAAAQPAPKETAAEQAEILRVLREARLAAPAGAAATADSSATTSSSPQSPASTTLATASAAPLASSSASAPTSVASATASAVAASETTDASVEIAKLQSEITRSRADAARERAAKERLRQHLEQTDAESFSEEMVYGLVAALVAILAVAGWLWQRSRRPWHPTPSTRSHFAARRDHVDSTPPHEPNLGPTPDFEEDIALFLASKVASESPTLATPAPSELPPSAPVAAPVELPVDFPAEFSAAPAPAVARVINPEELFDLQQQAEFFVSVGEHDQAIEVMSKHIAENEQSSPWAYLDLLRLYHSLSRMDDFNRLRDQFRRYFNAQVPDFVGFNRPGRTLAGYPDVLARIEAQWSTSAVLQELEGCLFRRDGDATAPFDLVAYDDLLLLYAIAQTIPPSSRGALPPRTRTTPLTPEQPEAPEVQELQELPEVPELPEVSTLPEVFSLAAAAPQSKLGLLDSGPQLDMGLNMSLEMGLDFDQAASLPWDEAPPAPAPVAVPEPTPVSDADALLEFGDSWSMGSASEFEFAPAPPPQLHRASAPIGHHRSQPGGLDLDLDLDLLQPSAPSTTELGIDLPLPSLVEHPIAAMPVTPAPAPDQPIGFSAGNDRFELRLEAENPNPSNPAR